MRATRGRLPIGLHYGVHYEVVARRNWLAAALGFLIDICSILIAFLLSQLERPTEGEQDGQEHEAVEEPKAEDAHPDLEEHYDVVQLRLVQNSNGQEGGEASMEHT